MPKRFFTLTLKQPRLSDDEYIAQARRNLQRLRWMRYLIALPYIAMTAMVLGGIAMFIDFLTQFGTPAGQQGAAYLLFALAIMLGFIAGFWLHGAVMGIVNAILIDDRKDRLLVECWDALQEVAREQVADATDVSVPPEEEDDPANTTGAQIGPPSYRN